MNAIYVRQSVDKRDSISIESQIESCVREIEDEPYRVYNDKGFSGKNTERPMLCRLMEDIKSGEISRVYVYRIDRISRAIVDFGKIMELFDEYNVEFISHTEKFDTSTPIGKAMLNIIMVFAQLERETIQQRIIDNYYSRGEKGFYLGGYAPFGYGKKEISKNGKRTYCYEIIESEADIVREIYERYAYQNESLGAIARIMNNRGVLTRKKCPWSQSTISRILHSPVYVRADAEVYQYLRNKGAHMNNPVSEYIGVNGCYVYGNTKNRKITTKFHTYDTDYVTLGAHEGIVSSELWLSVQQGFERRQSHSNRGSGSMSWLQGIVKCRECGYSCYIKKYRDSMYFYCRGKRNGICKASPKMIRADKLEEFAEKEILNRLDELQNVKVSYEENPEINKLKIQLLQKEEEIGNIVGMLSSADKTVMAYINEELKRLDGEKKKLNEKINMLKTEQCKNKCLDTDKIINEWNNLDIKVKKNIAGILFDRVEIDGYNIDIYLK